MVLQVKDFEICAGDDLDIDVIVTDDGTATGTPQDITGAQKIAFAAALYDVGNARQLTKSLGDGITITDAPGGAYTISIPGIDTTPLSGRYLYQSRIVDSAGLKTSVLRGTIRINPSILLDTE